MKIENYFKFYSTDKSWTKGFLHEKVMYDYMWMISIYKSYKFIVSYE